MLGEKQLDRLSAGLRHLRDAEHLAAHGEHRSLDQAWHLVGIALECLRKSGLSSVEDERAGRLLAHDFGDDTEGHLDWLIAIDAHAHRYQLGRWSEACPALTRWKIEARYDRNGTAAREHGDDLARLLEFGRQRANDLVVRMYSDGVLSTEEP